MRTPLYSKKVVKRRNTAITISDEMSSIISGSMTEMTAGSAQIKNSVWHVLSLTGKTKRASAI